MILTNKNILIISPEPWNHIFVSKHHYSVHLARKGNRVFFLNPPIEKTSVSSTSSENVFSVQYRGFITGFQYLPAFLRRYFLRRCFNKLQRLCECRFDVVWSFDNSVFYDFDALPGSLLKISHIVDLNQNFQTRRAAATADYCLCTTEFIKTRLVQFSSKVTKINHGFNLCTGDQHLVHRSQSKITALYSGNLAMPYIDWVIIERLVKDNSNVDFVFLGPNENEPDNVPVRTAKREVCKSSNVRFGGVVESNSLQGIYRLADILLIAYDQRYHKDQANPHKMMEYLGSGKVIVASFTSEYEELRTSGLIAMSERNSDLPAVFLATVENLLHWNSSEFQQARIRFALEHTYERQIEKIERLINK